MPRKFDQDAKERPVRLVEDRISAENTSMHPACQAAAPKLGFHGIRPVFGLNPARSAGDIPESKPEDLAAENAMLDRVNHQLHETNELLKAARVFRVITRPKMWEMIRFIDNYRGLFLVECMYTGVIK